MRVAVTGDAGALGRELVAALSSDHEVRWAPTVGQAVSLPVGGAGRLSACPTPGARPERVTVLEGDPRDPSFAAQVVDGVEALVHLGALDPAPGKDSTGIEQIDRATRGTHALVQAATKAGARRVVLGGSLDLFATLSPTWRVSETWRPRPEPAPAPLAAYLAEVSVRELSRAAATQMICLRFGHVVTDADVRGQAFDPRWLHVEDAIQGVRRALALEPREGHPQPGWAVYHIAAGGPRARVGVAGAAQPPLEYAPRHDFRDWWPPQSPPPAETWAWETEIAHGEPIPSRPIRRVVVYGAGGPLAAATSHLLAAAHTLRLTDYRPLADIIAENKPQSPGAPLPEIFGPPHEVVQVDVTDPAQVIAAARGMDAIVNCTVIRPDPVEAFRVNTLGAYNVMRAAVENRIRRVVHTGPQLVTLGSPAGYNADYFITADAPPRPADHLYGHTKYLGQEICRVFAEYYGLEVPVLLFNNFSSPERLRARGRGSSPFAVSWDDAGRAMQRAVEAPAFPSPFEVMHILTDLPHGKYSNEKAKRLLDWHPRDRLERGWSVGPEEEG
jgi:nucleoside-diphosphate-sugar epimerase